MQTVAFTGHRSISFDSVCKVRAAVREAVKALYHIGYRNFMSGMAIGFDMLAAEEVLSLKSELPGLNLIAVVPFRQQSERWSYRERQRREHILSLANDTIIISETYFRGCLLKRNDYMITHSSGLIAFFDGRNQGGTFYTCRKAKDKGKYIINLFL